ncbi:MAG: FtsX-like permease family protein, partial [Anaerolineales bacterium]|nr:FtsX-like permease family protein [Anaerolineales bacterium]
QIGDQLRTDDNRLRLFLVGVIEPVNPNDERWWGDLMPFFYDRPPNFSVQPDTVTLSAIVHPTTAADYFGSDTTWRILTDLSQINVGNVTETAVSLERVDTIMRNYQATLETRLPELIAGYQEELANARVTLFLLSIQSLIFVLYTLTMISSFLLDQSQSELASLAGRGFNSGQITRIFAVEGLLLALVAAPLGPPLARLVLQAWGRLTGTFVPSYIPSESWMLALVAILFGWVTLVTAVYLGTRGSILDWQRRLARPPQLAGWQRAYLDVFLLLLGGLIYWQLADSGSLLSSVGEAAGQADPFLLVGPSLLLIGVALLFLRIFPLLLRLVAWLTRQVDGLILPFGLARLSRDPVGPSRVVLLISLAAGLTLFVSTFENSFANRQAEVAHYQTGADLRVQVPNEAPSDVVTAVAAVDGVQTWSPVFESTVRYAEQLGRQAQMIAVDPDTFADVAWYAPGISTLVMKDMMPALRPGVGDAIPAIFSVGAFPQKKQVGDQVRYVVGQHRVTFEVRGVIQNFPATTGAFFITNLNEIEAAVNVAALSGPWGGSKEVWMTVSPAQHDEVVATVNGSQASGEVVRIVADARQQTRALAANMVAQQALGALNLNAATLTVLSIGIFLMVHFFAAKRRIYEFSLLRSMGLSARQLLGLLSLEGVMMMFLGLLAGSGLGFGLAAVMRPFLSRSLAVALGGDTIHQIVVNVPETAVLYLLLIAFYGLALAALLFTLLRSGIHRVLRIGEE